MTLIGTQRGATRCLGMPRYYFHLYNDVVTTDDEGVELSDLAAAREHAIEEARVMVCESVKKGHVNLEHRVTVTDETGANVLAITFREAFMLDG
jgi:hypothetical protein